MKVLRLLLLAAPGGRATWLPPWRQGRLLIGSSPSADARLAGAQPFHCVVEVGRDAPEVVVVHDLAHRGDVRDARGRPVPAEGLRVRAGEKFAIGAQAIAVVEDDRSSMIQGAPVDGRSCIVCATSPHPGDARGRTLEDVFVCTGCLGVVEIDPWSCPGYELVARLGGGASSSVFVAVHRELDRAVAIKVFRPETGVALDKVAARFVREAKLLSRLEHPHIVRVLDAGSAAGVLYLVSELVRGGDALGRVRKHGALAPREAARIGAQVADGLAHAHGLGIVHRDVKPANVLIERDGTAKLADFGLAKARGGEGAPLASLTGSNVALGTFSYAAPEQLRDGRSVGPPADVFGLGATLYHLVTGKLPRERHDLLDLAAHLDEKITPAATVLATIPSELSILLERSLASSGHDRPTMPAFRDALARLSA